MSNAKQGGHDGPGRAHGFSLPGTLIFVSLRSADFFLQTSVLRRFSPAAPLTFLGLTPYYTCVAAMVATASLRHVFWATRLCEQRIDPAFAFMVVVFNTVMNGLSVGMSLWPRMSNSPSVDAELWASPTRLIGVVLFVLGSFVETFAELQRKEFKKRPENRGKVFMGGLFGLARHVNYGGYLFWRTGLAMFAGGLPWAAVIAGYFIFYFLKLGIPALDEYCSKRYGEQWAEFKRRVPYKILPGIL